MKTFRKRLISFLSVAVGGKTGTNIRNTMDHQASEIEKTVPDAKVERVGEGIDIEFSCKSLFEYDISTKDGRSQNRRVEFLITANQKMKAEAEKETT